MASSGYHHRSASSDSTGHLLHSHHQQQQHHQYYGKPGGGHPGGGGSGGLPPPAPYHHQYQHPYAQASQRGGSGYYAYPPAHNHHYPPHHHHHHPHYMPRSNVPVVRSVVTHSFSMEEEQREDGSSRYGSHRQEANYPREEYRSPTVELGGAGASRDDPVQQQPPHNPFDPPPPPPPPFDGQQRDGATAVGGAPNAHYGRDLPAVPEEDESRMPPHEMMRASGRSPSSVRIPPSPREDRPPAVQKSHSTGGGPLPPAGYRPGQGTPLKRSFWHHSRPGGPGEEFEASLPQEFMPPKRTKVTPPGSSSRGPRDYVVTARASSDQLYDNRTNAMMGPGPSPTAIQSPSGPSSGWYGSRAMSWEAREDYYRRDPRSAPSWSSRSPTGRDAPSTGSGGHWSEAPYMPSPRSRYEGSHYDMPSQSWGSPRGGWAGHPQDHNNFHPPPPSPWNGTPSKDEHDSKHTREEREGYDGAMVGPEMGGAFDSVVGGGEPAPMHFTIRPPPHGVEFMGDRSSSMMVRGQGHEMMNKNYGVDKNGPIKLLALPEDRISLSETLCIVRENIEVFTATVEDVEAPAPGRKHAVTVGQVGLRCIHCRHTTRSSERVKRAVCYPSSIKRIYRTVIDMKLDHFLHCKFVPQHLKDTLTALKANNTRSTGTTMQYFIRAATSLGMVDGPSGVRMSNNGLAPPPSSFSTPQAHSPGTPKLLTPPPSDGQRGSTKGVIEMQHSTDKSDMSPSSDFRIHRTSSMSSEGTANNSVIIDESAMPTELFTGKITLALPEDKMSLSPLRCFLRQQVCAFSATEEDIAVRTPTTFSVSVGQVGIGCIHCMNQPAKLRLNRAVCFPFSIARIYQSVADIQRFHLSECKMVPKDIRDKFLELQSQSSKGSKGLATRQYWVTSAKKIGLVDTPKGIRFCRDPAVPEQKSVSLDILAQVASNVTTVNRPLVLPEDKPYIAEFLYVVMEQLQPCRFTEADRNKRRLKDVGCIGVECKHCAGQVDSRKFFWSSVNAVESNFVSVHTHMMECKMVPDELKWKLAELKKLRKEQTAALRTGSQKSFFARVWKRLHDGEAEQEKKEKENQMKKKKHSTEDEQKPVAMNADEKMAEESRDGPEPLSAAEVGDRLSQDPMELTPTPTPTASPSSVEKPMTEIKMLASPESNEKINAVSDKMAIVTMSETTADI
mmetsp:Transcript_7672/g.13927  ORF Transcript_7672/g.13927 Transcript_7672/m.13927 type:complete len:1176 (+) Transcript_7672:1-3528(+)